MVGVYETVGLVLLAGGAALLAFELIHPGALLLIPASILVVGGLLLAFSPGTLLQSDLGPILIVVAALIAALIEIPYYRWLSPGHAPMTTIPSTLVGLQGVVVSDVLPNTLKGKVRVGSEIWSARAAVRIPAGTVVRVVSGEGVSVEVAPIDAGTAQRPDPTH